MTDIRQKIVDVFEKVFTCYKCGKLQFLTPDEEYDISRHCSCRDDLVVIEIGQAEKK